MNRNLIAVLAVYISVTSCSGTNSTNTNEQPPLVQHVSAEKKSFIGHWVSVRANFDIIDIFNEGSLTIVKRAYEQVDQFKTPATLKGDNVITISQGNGSADLTMSDDGTKFYFEGNEYKRN